jgi:nucleosome binding factor SPN SPT16 subunit
MRWIAGVDTYVLHQTKEEHRKTAQVGRELKSAATHVAATKLLLVSLQQLNDLGLNGVSSSIKA